MTLTPLEQLDPSLRDAIKSIFRLRWIATAIIAVLVIAIIILLGIVVIDQNSELQASCALWYSIGTVSVTPVPPVTKPGEEGITLVIDARNAYVGQNCGSLPPPSAELKKWATYYGLTIIQ